MWLRPFLLSLTAGALLASASTLDFTATLPVIGGPLQFKLFTVSLTTPSASDPDWTLVIDTNYGAAIPGQTQVIPPVLYAADGVAYTMSDFLISWDGSYYGVVLAGHDGYLAGNLYRASGFQTGFDVMGKYAARPTIPVYLGAGGTKIGDGVVSGLPTFGDGVNQALYEITDRFAAPAGFLQDNTTFDIYASSYPCANGLILDSGILPSAPTPEPGTLLLCLPALAFAGRKMVSRKRRAA